MQLKMNVKKRVLIHWQGSSPNNEVIDQLNYKLMYNLIIEVPYHFPIDYLSYL